MKILNKHSENIPMKKWTEELNGQGHYEDDFSNLFSKTFREMNSQVKQSYLVKRMTDNHLLNLAEQKTEYVCKTYTKIQDFNPRCA